MKTCFMRREVAMSYGERLGSFFQGLIASGDTKYTRSFTPVPGASWLAGTSGASGSASIPEASTTI